MLRPSHANLLDNEPSFVCGSALLQKSRYFHGEAAWISERNKFVQGRLEVSGPQIPHRTGHHQGLPNAVLVDWSGNYFYNYPLADYNSNSVNNLACRTVVVVVVLLAKQDFFVRDNLFVRSILYYLRMHLQWLSPRLEN